MKFAGKLATSILIAAVAMIAMIAVSVAQEAIPQVIVFENTNMEGQHKHYFASDPDLTTNSDGRFWNDQISSMVIISGNWTFFADPVGSGEVSNPSVTLGPGVYSDVTKERIPDNSISQIRLEA